MEDRSTNRPGSGSGANLTTIQVKKPSTQVSQSITVSPNADSHHRLGEGPHKHQKHATEDAQMALELPDVAQLFQNQPLQQQSEETTPAADSFVSLSRFRENRMRMPVTSATSPPLDSIQNLTSSLVSPVTKTLPKGGQASSSKSNPLGVSAGKPNNKGTTQSHRVQNKLKQQSNMSAKLQGLQQYQAKQVTEAAVKRRNNSPMMTMHASTDKQGGASNIMGQTSETKMKQSKTRNNLQSHVISSTTTRPNKAVVGQPYIAFKQQQPNLGSQLPSKVGSGRSKFDSMERSSQIYQKHYNIVKGGGSRFQQAKTQIKLKKSQDQQTNSSIDSELVNAKFHTNPMQSLRANQKSSFSKESSINGGGAAEQEEGSDGGLKCPQIISVNQKPLPSLHSSGPRLDERSAGSNFVVNIGGGIATTSSKQNKLNYRQQRRNKQTKSSWTVGGANSNVQTKPTKTLQVHRVSGGDYEDLPIVISDQNPRKNSVRMPQIVSSASRSGDQDSKSLAISHRQQSLESPQMEMLHQIPPLHTSIGLHSSINGIKNEASSRTQIHQTHKHSETIPKVMVTAGNVDTSSEILLDKIADDAQTVQPEMNKSQISQGHAQESSMMEVHPTQDSHLDSYQSNTLQAKGIVKIKTKFSMRNEAGNGGALFVKDKQGVQHPSLDPKATFYETGHSRTSKNIGGAPFEKSQNSLRSILNNPATSKVETNKERQYLLHRQMMNSKQIANFQSQQFKKHATKESVRLEPILNTRYQKATLDHNSQRAMKESQEGTVSTRRNISQLSQNTKDESTSQSMFKGYGKKQRDKTSGAKSGLQRHDGNNKSLRQIRTKENNDYYGSTKIPAGKKLTSLDTASNRILKAGFNKSLHDQDELMLIKQDNSQATISMIKPDTEANQTVSDENNSSSLGRGGRCNVEMLDFSSQEHFEHQSTFNNSVVTTQTNQRTKNRQYPFRTNDEQMPVVKKDLKRGSKQQQEGQRQKRKKSLVTLENLPYTKSIKVFGAGAEKKRLQKQIQSTLGSSPADAIVGKGSPAFASLRKDGRQSGLLYHQMVNKGAGKTEGIKKHNDSSMGLSNSVASLPQIVGDDKGSKSTQMKSGRRLGSHRPSHISMMGKLSLQGENQSPRQTQQQEYLNQLPPKHLSHMLTPRNYTKFQQHQQAKTNKFLRKSTHSFRTLKNERRTKPTEEAPAKETRFQSPKQKRRVSIKQDSEVSHIYESPVNRALKPVSFSGAGGHLSKHTKSNSVALATNLNMRQVKEEQDLRSVSTSIHKTNHSFRNENQCKTLQTKSMTVEVEPEHQIRIEISKTEVLDAMKKDHMKDLSLLYYDFNNSKARLMSKMKKMSDFVIQEEAQDDGDVPLHPQAEPAASQTNMARERRRHEGSMEMSKIDSPLSAHPAMLKKQQSNKNIETASSAIKHLDIPTNVRSSGLISSHDVSLNDVSKTQMNLINQKIQKAKQSISQLHSDGVSLSLQSPVRLAGSRNSSTKTTGQNIVDDLAGSINSSAKKGQKKIFLFNQHAQKVDESSPQGFRNKSPCFGSVKNSQGEGLSGSHSMQSLQLVLPSKQLISQASELAQQQHQINTQNGSTGTTEIDANFGIMAASQTTKHGMGTGFQTSLATRDKVKKKLMGTNSGILIMSGSPVPTHRRSVQIEEQSDLAILSSKEASIGDLAVTEMQRLAEENDQSYEEEQENVTSVVQFVKENRQIWE